jgi:hypothetical protein
MGLYFIYDNDYFGSRQFVRDIKREVYLPQTNAYVKNNVTNGFVQMTNDFIPDSKQELLNIYYTAVNSGWESFTFYCRYSKCIEDVNNISTDNILLSNINSFVSPYNQYETISTYTTPLFNAKVNIVISRTYDSYFIEKINARVNEIYNELELEKYNNDKREQIELVHDYIINNTKYDSLKIDNIDDNTYSSNTAYGTFFQGFAVCSGYADAMAIILDKLNIPNIKVASATHVWNLVNLDNKWYHLDLTWDDPYNASGSDILNHNFFLIDYQKLKKWNTVEHTFDQNVYKEAL